MFHAIEQVFAGTREIDNKLKYQGISFIIALVHLAFFLFFLSAGLKILYVYNLLVVLFYMSMVFLLARSNLSMFVFLSAFGEILFHSVFASVLLGWNAGFMSYTVALIPMAFYMAYTLPGMKKNLLMPLIATIIISAANFATLAYTRGSQAFYAGGLTDKFTDTLFSFNLMCTIIYLWLVSILFSLEIRFMQHHLEAENISLSRLANYDALTHLMNRRSMNIQLKEIFEEVAQSGDSQENPFCLLMADIDDFKKVNDTYGHSKGDEVLVEVARVLQSNVRQDDKVSRWGGEEMLILLRSDIEVARKVAQRICSDMEASMIETPQGDISVTLTIGVSEYHEGESLRSMIETADQRMYRGKRSGKNCVIWN